ncbi:type II toxin-antitoxin system Xre/ParS family antitoxin [Calidithermus timidus]|jgi:putative toxin-antitoxin system antitoxin component (TIGR02293 family)|uniref:type II RES/Xre toxin-antitoxin system antitoxin n=1 Tax=Calidithermus timidus TaxID=307124 RepID=UPI000373E271|nr:antitoxin Xre/MbcA/ParS toxin-binding domain-containing protein [Calidithermus timidus]
MEIAMFPARTDPTLEPLAFFGLNPHSTDEGIRELKSGLPVEGWAALVHALDTTEKALAEVVQLPLTTLARRKKTGRFTPEESERLLRIARLVAQAQQVFRTEQGVARWFKKPNRALGGKTPLEYASTPIGAEEVERVLERLLDGGPA